jgi:hypothetical protein
MLIQMLSLGLLLDNVSGGSLHIVSIHWDRFFQGTLLHTSILARLQHASSYRRVTWTRKLVSTSMELQLRQL